MAGLWESWKAPDAVSVRTPCIITTTANALMAPVHDRIPMIIAEAYWPTWFGAPVDAVVQVIHPYAGDDLQAWPVDRRVSRTGENDEHLIARLSLTPDDSS